MAKKKSSTNGEIAPPPQGKEAFRLINGLFFAALAIYTFVALTSYLFTWAEDQSLLSRTDVWNNLVPVENGGGKVGFFWANLLLSELFGLGAFIIPFFFLGIAVYSLKIRKVKLLRIFLLSAFGAIILSVFFSYVFGFTKFDTWFGNGVGGSYGYYVNEWLISMLGPMGAGGVVMVLLMLWLVILNYKIVIWFNNLIAGIFHRKPKEPKESKAEKAAALAAAAALASESASAESGSPNISASPEVPGAFVISGSNSINRDVVFEVEGADYLSVNDAAAASGIAAKGVSAAGANRNTQPEGFEVGEIELDEDDEIETENDEEDFLKDFPKGSLDTLFDPRLDLSDYQLPPLNLLDDYKDKIYKVPHDELEKNNRKIVKTLGDYKIAIERIFARTGPTVTLYEIVPAAGVRISQIKRLEDDIALSLAARGVRIIAPIPGTNAVGIEVANDKPSIVPMRSVLEDPKFKSSNFDLPVVLGRTISNEALMFDLAKMPHLLVAGATGQGKSVGLNAVITSLLYTKHPSELKFVLVDPKKVELSLYAKLERHFLAKLPDSDDAIITDTQKVVYTLRSLTIEMDARYDLLKIAHVRNIKEYNEKFLSRRLNPNKGHRYMPFIVVIIDEFADLLMTAGREIEEPIARLAQLARAIGIHLVIATQRPTTNIITGLIKANFPARIAFRVISNIDSRTILDTTGANQLIGRGDMLFSTSGELTRVQCAFIDTPEVERICEFIGSQRGYSTAHFLPEYVGEEGEMSGAGEIDLGKRDKLFEEAAKLVVQFQQGSTSLIQRRMNLGYNRAGRIMDQLEAAGIVGPFEGSKARQVLITDFNSLDRILASLE
ncbi:MAG: DNA translocase FtsK 4TM domain-containing protein [Bacteroidales bacterium]|jgi:S-DNA-T family DNA segregation ATPase FtsK/SpoIIIE